MSRIHLLWPHCFSDSARERVGAVREASCASVGWRRDRPRDRVLRELRPQPLHGGHRASHHCQRRHRSRLPPHCRRRAAGGRSGAGEGTTGCE